jgi:hypothetical protein
MTDADLPPDPVAPPTPPMAPRTWKTWHLVTAAVVALVLGIGLGAASASSDDQGDSPKSTNAAAGADSSTTTTEQETTTSLGRYTPAPADFTLTVVTTEQSCFGSAGCNVTYQIDVAYHGPRPLEPSDEWLLIYEVRGGEDLKVGNITVRGDGYSRDEDMISTGTGPRLEAVVTSVREG